MPPFDMGMSGAVPDAQDARATSLLLGQGQFRVPIDSGYGDVYRPFATGYKDQRILTLETLYDFFINNVPDPDSAMAQDPNFDAKMDTHPDVVAAFRKRELTVASFQWQIQPSEKRDIDPIFAQKVADYVEDVIEDFPNFVEFIRMMQRAVLLGGQGFELVWANVNGYDRPVEYFPVHKSRFVFDRLGNMAALTRSTPVWGAYVGRTPQRMPTGEFAYYTPGGRFIYHKYMAEGGPWQRPADEGYLYWGRGENTRLYIPVTFDNFVIRFRMRWLEKHGMPLTVMYHPDNWNPQAVTDIATQLREESIIRIPKKIGGGEMNRNHFFELDFKEPSKMGYDAFQEFQDNWVKNRIERILLGAADTGEQGEKGGYAAKTQLQDSGPGVIFKYDAQNCSETINHQLIPYIVWARYPGLENKYFPKFVMEPKEEKDEKARLEVAQLASTMVPIRRDEIYEASGFSRPKEGDQDVVFNPNVSENPFEGMGGIGGGNGLASDPPLPLGGKVEPDQDPETVVDAKPTPGIE